LGERHRSCLLDGNSVFVTPPVVPFGEMRNRSYENQRYRASGLNLVVAAILLWKTVYLERAVQDTGKDVGGTLLAYLSPLGWEHINLTGDYVWQQSRQGQFRPLRGDGAP
jgi:hypothetical protein